jgi:ubiquinone/menaquinone biosynthesis C-methylase UbiE
MNNYTVEIEKEFKVFWDKMENPSHAHNTEKWFKKYYDEWKFLLKNRGHIVDAGCGSGEFIKLMQNDFELITGIDYSESMLKKTKDSLNDNEKKKTNLFHGSIKNISNILNGVKVDSIVCNQVIQYLTQDDTLKFIRDSFSCLNENGELVIMNIPNFNLKELYNIKLFKRQERITYKMLIKEIVSFHWLIFKQKIKSRNYKYTDGIGNWFLISEFEGWAEELNIKIEIFYSLYTPYGYRFHVRLTK